MNGNENIRLCSNRDLFTNGVILYKNLLEYTIRLKNQKEKKKNTLLSLK